MAIYTKNYQKASYDTQCISACKPTRTISFSNKLSQGETNLALEFIFQHITVVNHLSNNCVVILKMIVINNAIKDFLGLLLFEMYLPMD